MPTTTLHWSISGEFITETARNWFWSENKPYEVCEELLVNCLVNPNVTLEDRKRLARDIIEGRKKITGVNELTVEDDGENIRPLQLKIKELTRKNKIYETERCIESNPIIYVDPYATSKSIRALTEGLTRYRNDYNTKETLQDYFCYHANGITEEPMYDMPLSGIDKPSRCGLWLWENPELIIDVCEKKDTRPGTPEFWEGIYEYTKERPEFHERNMRYLAATRISPNDINAQPVEDRAVDKPIGKPVKPSGLKSWIGLVDTIGNFYSCEFAEHETLAYKIIVGSPEKFPEKESDVYLLTRALDILINKYHWCALRDVWGTGKSIRFPDDNRITSAQKNTIWEAITKFDVHIKIPEILMN